MIPQEEDLPLMQTAQVAVQESKIVAINILKHHNQKQLQSFKYVFLSSAVSLGGKKGVADLIGKFELKGFTAWCSWKLSLI